MKELINRLLECQKNVFVTGAGISTLSGIADFRGKNGLYNKNDNVETILSINYFNNFPEEFYEFYRSNLIVKDIKPNIVHEVLSELEKKEDLII